MDKDKRINKWELRKYFEGILGKKIQYIDYHFEGDILNITIQPKITVENFDVNLTLTTDEVEFNK